MVNSYILHFLIRIVEVINVFSFFHVGNFLPVLKVILNFCYKVFCQSGLLSMQYVFCENGNKNEVFSALAACMQGHNTVL